MTMTIVEMSIGIYRQISKVKVTFLSLRSPPMDLVCQGGQQIFTPSYNLDQLSIGSR